MMSLFLEQALVFIGASALLVPICQRLGFGSVLGYLVAGVTVGPHGFRLIADTDSVLHFSELGVVLLLFLTGLELEPRKLWSMRHHLLGLGGIQVLVTSIVFAGAGMALGLSPRAAGAVGFALSLSSTAFALQTLAERRQLNTEFGRAAFATLLMQDLVAIPSLALLPALAASASSETNARGVGIGAVVILVLILLSRPLLRPLFRLIASNRSREIFTIASLFIVLGVAGVMEHLGLSAALGAFIAGVLLADSEYRHEFEANLEPFKALLMGLFFMGVGMGVDLSTLLENPAGTLAAVFAYLTLKGSILYGVSRLFRLNHENAKAVALTIAQGGEFAFVLFNLSGALAVAPPSTLSFLATIVTLSMALSPILSLFSEKWSSHFQKAPTPQYDAIEGETPKVIIAGFGRFGQIFGRILRAQSIPFVAIDHDSEQIELVRKFGSKVYYGDASRLDLLVAAGAAEARYFVLAIDDVEMSLATARTLRTHFPDLKIYARARNRGHVFDLMAMGIHAIKRETFDSSVHFVEALLVDLGFEPDRAGAVIDAFRKHDQAMLLEQYKVRDDDKRFVSVSKQGSAQLEEVLRRDQK